MLSKEDNELLTQVSPGTPMGNLIRRYWVPALLSEEVPQPDCPPVRVRMLGEELVAFRDSEGRIGLLGERCAHRGTSLFYGRNEDCGLRCIYHGWKYGVDGHVLDMPAEPGDSDFRKKLHHTAYPTHEAGGVIYAYLGPRDKMPLFPNYEWTQVPFDQTYVTKCLLECNYLQGLEGECDSSHLSFLHRAFTNERNQPLYKSDTSPIYETEETDFGVRLIATRNSADNQHYVRFSAFVMPVYGCVPAGRPTNELDGYEIPLMCRPMTPTAGAMILDFAAIVLYRPMKFIGANRSARIISVFVMRAMITYRIDRCRERSTSPASRTFSTMTLAQRRAWVRSSIAARNISGSATKRSSPYGNFF